MKKPVTPGRLARWGLYVLGSWVIVALVIVGLETIANVDGLTEVGMAFGVVLVVIAAVLLLAAGVAKVIQIGVRSAQDGRRDAP